MLMYLIAAALLVSWVYLLVAWWAIHRFFKSGLTAVVGFSPPVSILKPVKGLDPEAFENFTSFCRQRYPRYELLFGVDSQDDPCVPLIKRLQAEFPAVDIRLLVCHCGGCNPKSGILAQLTTQARFDQLVISDSDIRVADDYLQRVVAPLADPSVGVVTCAYRTVSQNGWIGVLESLYLNTSFIPSVVLAERAFGWRYGLGATLAMRRSDLLKCGGYNGIGGYLADDFQIARRIQALGLRAVVSPCLVDNIVGGHRLREQWRREVRWAVANRTSKPLGYRCLALTMTTPLALLFLCIAPGIFAAAVLAVSLLLRWLAAWRIQSALGLRFSTAQFICLPLRDVLSAAVWLTGLAANRIEWRGRNFRLLPDGRLQPQPICTPHWAGTVVKQLDRVLRRWGGIFEFSADVHCLLRVAVEPSRRCVTMADGAVVRQGAPIAELHYWNEHMPQAADYSSRIAWAKSYRNQMELSFRELAGKLNSDHRLQNVCAIHAEMPFAPTRNRKKLSRLASFAGFEIIEPPARSAWVKFWRNMHERLLMRLFNPAALSRPSVAHVRRSVWISRAEFVERYFTLPPSVGAAKSESMMNRQAIVASHVPTSATAAIGTAAIGAMSVGGGSPLLPAVPAMIHMENTQPLSSMDGP